MQVHDDTATDTPDDTVTDGRRARRERGRSAVCEAMIDLVFEGHQPPTTEQIAERAGVSVASLFRYFDTLDDTRRDTTDLYFDRFSNLFEIADIGAGSLAERIERFVVARATLYETTEPMCRLVRIRAHESQAVEVRYDLARSEPLAKLHDDGTEADGGEIPDDELRRVRQQQRDAVPGLDAERPQTTTEAIDLVA